MVKTGKRADRMKKVEDEEKKTSQSYQSSFWTGLVIILHNFLLKLTEELCFVFVR